MSDELKQCTFFSWCPYKTAICLVRMPDEGCYLYRSFEEIIKENNNVNTDELKPCPFCGESVKILSYSFESKPYYGIEHFCRDRKINVQLKWKHDMKEVIEEWNRRVL